MKENKMFETSSNPPLRTQGGGGTASDPVENFFEEIHGLVKEGTPLEDIHSAIDKHPDMYNKDAFKEYAQLMHKAHIENAGIIKGENKE